MNGERPTVGLDFGTTTTLVASHRGVVPIGTSDPWMPSLVGYGDVSVVAGEHAQDLTDDQVARSVKRSITDSHTFVRLDTPTGFRDVRADDLIVAVLREAAGRAAANGLKVTDRRALWLGCPAMWDGKQRRRLADAARRAGLPVGLANLVDEPVAAGIAWLADRAVHSAEPLRVLVFDMGGGTLDIAVLDVRGSNHRDVSVLAAIGMAEAGDTLDEAITVDLDYALSAAGVDIDSLSKPERARRHLLHHAAPEAKISLSTEQEHPVVLSPRLFGSADEVWYTRQQLNAAFEPQMDHALQYVAVALRAARVTELAAGTAADLLRVPIEELAAGVDVVLLSGGMSHAPYVMERMRGFFPPSTRIEFAATPPENAVALGLAKAPQYGRINMYRPAFDVVVEWSRGRESRTIYDAYTPLVDARRMGGGELCYVRNGPGLSLPPKKKGRLRVVSYSGQRVRATLAGTSLDGFPVAWTDQAFEFAIYPNGRIRVTDARGVHEGHIDSWHTVHGHDNGHDGHDEGAAVGVAPPRQPHAPVPLAVDGNRS